MYRLNAYRVLTCAVCLGVVGLSTRDLSAQDVAITNARVIVGNGTVIDSGTVIVRGGKIVSVSAGAANTQGLKTIDAKGMSAMPGFIDAHRHINTGPDEKAQMQALLEAGYTTILSGGGPADGNLTLRDHIEKGVINGPRIIPSGRVQLRNNTPDMARAEIRKMAEMGVKFTGEIGLTPVPGPTEQELEVLRAVVDEAKKVGVMVQVHAVSSSAMVAAVEAGARLLVHLPNKDWVSREDAKKLADSGTKILTTSGFGAPVFGVFANDNKPRFRDGKPWPEGIVDGVRLGEEAGYMLGQCQDRLGSGRHPRVLHRYELRSEGGAGPRAERSQRDVLDAGHRQADGPEHRLLHPDERSARNPGAGQIGRSHPSRRQSAGRLLEHAENQGRPEGRRRCSR